ncbi:hypothetical protein BCV72DRAFT_314835 [Rhizopus microsporus var. microsporus]|uniref:Uncharacterized protein n=1 Tax=Rhizopus microsporus var. microsporus TaxID=86635 RepID=A0A1X0QV51_RHIZD|nr:hypothetical protein BCV72DRAFT_314835 [Rhizopus microsporus var. microsporus]
MLTRRSITHKIYSNDWQRWTSRRKDDDPLQFPADYNTQRLLKFLVTSITQIVISTG